MAITQKKLGKLLLSYPSEPIQISYGDTHSIAIPSLAIHALAIVGSITAIIGLKYLGKAACCFWKFLRSRFNKLPKAIQDKSYIAIYGANSKIGLHLTRYFMDRDYNVLIIDNKEKLEFNKLTGNSKVLSVETLYLDFDVLDSHKYEVMRQVFENCGMIKIFINCKRLEDSPITI